MYVRDPERGGASNATLGADGTSTRRPGRGNSTSSLYHYLYSHPPAPKCQNESLLAVARVAGVRYGLHT